jgi:hypothetical protein
MSNLKISQLPNFTGNTSGSWLIANNSGETETFKIQKESFLSGYATTGSNTFIGTETISGSVLIQGGPGAIALAINQGNFRISGSIAINSTTSTGIRQLFFTHPSGSLWGSTISYNPISGPSGSGSLRIENGISGSIVIGGTSENFIQGTNFIQGRTHISGSNTTITGSLGINGNTEINGNTTISGSVNVSGSVVLAPNVIGYEGINFKSGSGIGAFMTYSQIGYGFLGINTWGAGGEISIGSGGSSGSALVLNKSLGGITTLIGSSSISLQGNNINVTGSLTASGSAHRIVGDVTTSGSLTVTGGVSSNTYYPNNGSMALYGLNNDITIAPKSNSGTNGKVINLGELHIKATGTSNPILHLDSMSTTPSGSLGDIMVSGSGLYFHNGTSWNLIS